MKQLTLLTLLLFLALSVTAHAGVPKVISLKDGTRIQGRIIGIENGRYVIDSPTLGEVRVPEDSVVSILLPGEAADPGQAAPPAQGAPGTHYMDPAEFKTVQDKIMANPDIMSEIQSLMQDPEVMAAMSDPVFLQAAQNKDPEAMKSSPQLQKLMSNPKIQDIIQKLQSSQ